MKYTELFPKPLLFKASLAAILDFDVKCVCVCVCVSACVRVCMCVHVCACV